MAKQKERKITEFLLVPGLGYLKVPRCVKDEYGPSREYPNPTHKVIVNGKKIQIIYEFVMEPKDKEEKT